MYKTIVVHVDDTAQLPRRLAVAATLAAQFGGRVIGSAVTGITRPAFLMLNSSIVAAVPDDFEMLRQQAIAQLELFSTAMKRLDVETWETRLVEDDAEHALLLESGYADLVILSPGTPSGARARLMTDLPDYVALHGVRPVLVVPSDYASDTVGKRIVVGWDAGAEATRAVTAALPLLQGAQQVTVAVVNPDPYDGRHGEQPGADLATWLSRHGVPVDVVREHGQYGVAAALLGIARDTGADLLVAGAYGHSRFREWFVGGATRELLDDRTIPLLLAH